MLSGGHTELLSTETSVGWMRQRDMELKKPRPAFLSKGVTMRIAIIALFLSTGLAFAQTTPPTTKNSPGTTSRMTTEKKEAQPLNTKSGGAPASSPQGETPPGMQSAPDGSSKQVK